MRDVSVWLGRAISGLVAVIMIADGLVGLLRPHLIVDAMARDGWPPRTVLPIALAALTGGMLYAFRRTSLLGAILITGFAGGALAAHLRVTPNLIWPEIVNILLGVAAWAGLYLRDPRLKRLLIERP